MKKLTAHKDVPMVMHGVTLAVYPFLKGKSYEYYFNSENKYVVKTELGGDYVVTFTRENLPCCFVQPFRYGK